MSEKVIASADLEMETLDLLDFLNKHVGENGKIVACPIYFIAGAKVELISSVSLKQDDDGSYSLELS
ncbi:hypothetical protein ACVIGB_000602 [Bradyrhizobium sp. USDA 4341]